MILLELNTEEKENYTANIERHRGLCVILFFAFKVTNRFNLYEVLENPSNGLFNDKRAIATLNGLGMWVVWYKKRINIGV
ncbi:hypothetical protein GCM10028774_15920 [Spirosoma jeollabukense]